MIYLNADSNSTDDSEKGYCPAIDTRSHRSHVTLVLSQKSWYQSVMELEYKIVILQLEVHGSAIYTIV
jgi:hypothetical protein